MFYSWSSRVTLCHFDNAGCSYQFAKKIAIIFRASLLFCITRRIQKYFRRIEILTWRIGSTIRKSSCEIRRLKVNICILNEKNVVPEASLFVNRYVFKINVVSARSEQEIAQPVLQTRVIPVLYKLYSSYGIS